MDLMMEMMVVKGCQDYIQQVHAVFSEGSAQANPVNPVNSPKRFLTGLF